MEYWNRAIANYMDVHECNKDTAIKELKQNQFIYGFDFILYYSNQLWND